MNLLVRRLRCDLSKDFLLEKLPRFRVRRQTPYRFASIAPSKKFKTTYTSMTDHTTSFLKRLKGITLSNNERLQMRERVALYADMHALGEETDTATAGSFFALIGSRRFSLYATAFLVVLIAGSGVTLAAEGSVPGDSLYALKIDVNEPVMVALAPTASGQAKVAANIATRRVDEAVTLASRGELTPERQTYLTTQFNARIKVAAKKADELASTGDSSGAETVKANLAANLAGEAQALGAVTTKDSAESSSLLRVVVATSENISSQGDQGAGIAIASDVEATTTLASGTSTVRTLARTKTASTTARTLFASRFVKRLQIASSTLENHAALSNFLIAQPKTDSALPQSGTSGNSSSEINLGQ
jgi:hypothetical protein